MENAFPSLFLLESFATKNNENIEGCKQNWYNKKM